MWICNRIKLTLACRAMVVCIYPLSEAWILVSHAVIGIWAVLLVLCHHSWLSFGQIWLLLLPTHVACCASFFSTLWDVWAEIIRILIGYNFYRDNVCSSVCKDLWCLWSEFEKPHTVICNSSVIAFETPFTETSLLLLLVFIGDSILSVLAAQCPPGWCLTAPIQCLHSKLKHQKICMAML